MPEVKPIAETFAKIKVVGIGGAGGNAVNRMVEEGIQGVEFIAINTDVQALHNNKADIKLHIGKTVTRGLGAGMNPELGRQAAEESQSEIRDLLKGSDMVFITCGLGGGTGTGAAPLIAEIAKDLGALTIAVVTKPFSFEGGQRKRIADRGYDDLSAQVDTIITVANEKLLTIIDKKTSLLDSFRIADNILRQGVQGIAEIITVPGIVNADFNDVRAIMANTGSALMGIGQATGENKAEEAVRAAINSNLLETSINGAKGIVFTITGGTDLSMMEVSEAARIISSLADEDAKIIFGAVIDDRLKDELKVTIVATGFNDRERVANNFSPTEISTPAYTPSNFVKREENRKKAEVKKEEVKETKNTSLNFSWFEKKEKPELKAELTRPTVKPQIKKTDDEEDEELSVPAFIRKKMM